MKKNNVSSRRGASCGLRVLTRALLVILLIGVLAVTVLAYFTWASTAFVDGVLAGDYAVNISASGETVDGTHICTDACGELHTFTLSASGTASTGYCTVTVDGTPYTTTPIDVGTSITLNVRAKAGASIDFTASWGSPEADRLYGDGDTIRTTPLTISVMGDSISTYTGWSDAEPITDETCRFRYGEAYYGPEGGDFHNTEMVVEDTWWHQAATQLGMDILRVNAGNSTGLLYASYPANADWDEYLKGMLAYKSRPNYLGRNGVDPDIIALYIGSNDVGKGVISEFGSIEQTDLDALIVENEDGSFTYAEPKTVADAYCILLHKIRVNYPDAEIYCFAVVPNAGGYLSTCNKRLAATYPFNDMVRGVADYYGAHVVELLEYFQLDPDGDGVAVQEDWERFQSFYHNDPHPNAAGFDVITECFVSEVLAHSKYAE